MRVPDILCPVLFYCDKFTVAILSTVENSVENLVDKKLTLCAIVIKVTVIVTKVTFGAFSSYYI